MVFIIYKTIPHKNSLIPLLFIPFFTNIHYENQLCAFQSQFYLMIIFFSLAIYFGIKKNNILLFLIFTGCSMFSMTFIIGPALALAYFLKERKLNRNVLIVFSIITLFIILFAPFTPDNSLVYPNTFQFWTYYLGLLLKGIFNIETNLLINMPNFIIFILILLTYFVFNFFKTKNEKINPVYTSFIIVVMFLAFGITVGRGKYMIFSSRYLIIITTLIPIIGSILINIGKKYYTILFSFIIMLCFSNCFTHNIWEYSSNTRAEAKKDLLLNIKDNKKPYGGLNSLHVEDLTNICDKERHKNFTFLNTEDFNADNSNPHL